MIYFNCDYLEGMHPSILKKLEETNLLQTVGYGEDNYCEAAAQLIKDICKSPEADVHFLVGGTQANLTVISSALRPHECVLSAKTGHVNTHETGAIEATGHKVEALPCGTDGKITAAQVSEYCSLHYSDAAQIHTVKPGMVYISHPTENGMLYTKQELANLREICDKYGLIFYLDGARLSYALTSDSTDVSIDDISKYCDVFYIGGTKCGAMFGEAVVINHPIIKKDFRYFIKQKGALLSKGRFLGIQFQTLFENNLYCEIAKKANMLAQKVAQACRDFSIPLLTDSPTNQQFLILSDTSISALSEKYGFSHWQKIDDTHSAIRICTSWATKSEHVDQLISDLKELSSK
jgi:Threonine aldolase